MKNFLVEGGRVRLAEGDKVDWDSPDTGVYTLKDLVAVNARLFLNKTNTTSATQGVVDDGSDVASRFWDAVGQIDGFGDEDARAKTVAAQPVVLKALAKLVYDFAFGSEANAERLQRLLDGITELDLSHENPAWQYYAHTPQDRKKFTRGLEEYLPPEDTANRDLGAYANGVMRFGAKHNDIVPILGDIIRWELKLPSRHAPKPAEA